MRRGLNLGMLATLAVGLGVAGYYGTRPEATAGQQPVVRPAGQPAAPGEGVQVHASGVPRYSVVETMGTNLLVVDNTKNVLYFYTCDEGKKAGDSLKLRGSIDLTQVGQPTLTPKGHPKSEGPKGDREPKSDR